MLPSLQLVLGLVCLLVTGCSSDSGTSSPSGTSGSGGAGSAGGGSGGGSEEDAQVGLDAGQVGDASTSDALGCKDCIPPDGSPPPDPLGALGSLVILGDSIGSGGGQPPFYFDVLRADLEAKYGALTYYNHASSGSTTAALASQIDELPNALPGPVAVVITSGTNDLQAAIPMVLQGNDQAARAAMSQNVAAALDALLLPNRFGPSVEVFVYEANIYDASDGSGDLGPLCGYDNVPPLPIAAILNDWNGAIASPVLARGQTLKDIHALFAGHGLQSTSSWFVDCGHPNSLGHAALAQFFYSSITGE